MNNLAPESPTCRTGDTQAMYDALRRGPSAAAVARLLGTPRVARIRRDRVLFSGTRPPLLALNVEQGNGALVRIWAEWLGDEAAAHAAAERTSLRKSRRGQIVAAEHGGILADAQGGFVLRLAGLDSKLPGLRLLYDLQAAADWIGRVEQHHVTAEDLRVTLVAHRLGKRAVLRLEGPDGYLRYARLRATKSRSGHRSFDSHVALWQALGQSRDLRVPAPVGFDPELGIALFRPLAGTPPDFTGLAGYRACRDICRALAELRALGVEAAPHSARDEMDIVGEWAGRLRGYAPDLGDAVSQAFDGLAEDMNAMPEVPPVPCHRDLHEKQILLSQEGAGLLDFDTLRLGDPALDVGNLQAHLYLAGRRNRRTRTTFEDALLMGMPPGLAGRAAIWRRAALLRLAGIYAFTDEPCATIDALIREATGGRDG